MEGQKGVKTQFSKSSNFIEKQSYFNLQNEAELKGKNTNSYRNMANGESICKIDSLTVQMMIYKAEMYILTKYPYLVDLNEKNKSYSKTLKNDYKFFMIKSFTEEDVHKAIKYNLWTSSDSAMKTLDEAYNSKEKVLLIFNSKQSGRLLGIAEMKSRVAFEKYFPLWTQDFQKGFFEIEWIYIKDIPYYLFKDVKILMNDGVARPITFCRNAQEIPYESAKKSIEIIENYYNTNTILEHFEYYDIRQENYERMFPQNIYK